MGKTAILVDGAFYRKRAFHFWGDKSPEARAKELCQYCKRHIKEEKPATSLYRVFYYDCPPSDKAVYHPLLDRSVELGSNPLFSWTEKFFDELRHQRKFALRLGRLAEEQAYYTLRPAIVRKLVNGTVQINELKESDFVLSIQQKGVDMRIGIDISSLAFKRQVDQIILISGDSDFVPAAKQARREGIDFILDPMRMKIKDDLYEHIDGLRTKAPKEPQKDHDKTK